MLLSALFGIFVTIMIPIGSGVAHDDVLQPIRVGNAAEEEMFFFGSALNADIAIIEKGLEETVDVDGNILDAGELELAHFPGEEAVLFDIDDAVIRDDPGIEPDIDPDEKDIDPGEEEYRVLDEEEEGTVFGCEEGRKNHRKGDEADEEYSHEAEDGEKVNEDIEPVAVRYLENAFFRCEKIVEWLHRKCL